MILVTGVTGNVGGAAADALVEAGAPVRGISRDAGARRAGVEIVAGDLADSRAVGTALEGVETLLLVIPPDPELLRGGEQLIAAADAAGVGHIVYLSVCGADLRSSSHSLAGHAHSEHMLARASAQSTVLRANSYMQNLLADAPTIRAERSFHWTTGTVPLAKVDTRDVGAAMAAVALDSALAGVDYELTGPQALTGDDMAAAVSDALGEEVRYVDHPPDAFRARLLAASAPQWLADEVLAIYAQGFYADGAAGRVSPDLEALLGRPPRTFAEFAADHVELFRAEAE